MGEIIMSALGTEFKYGIRIQEIDGYKLKDYDFDVTTYVYTNKSVTYKKGDTKHIKPIDDDSYMVIVPLDDAMKIGGGKVMAKVTCHIPDADFQDGYRTEVYDKLWTGLTIT
jgi:hypothetical protein